MEAKELLIYPNKKRMRLIFASGILFLGLGFLLWYLNIYFWGGIILLIGILNMSTNYKRAFLNAPVLKINEEGIVDNMNFPNLGKILWSNIKEAKIEKVTGVEHIVVYLKDPNAYFEELGLVKRYFAKENHKKLNSCIMFRTNVFPEKKQQVLDLINRLAKG